MGAEELGSDEFRVERGFSRHTGERGRDCRDAFRALRCREFHLSLRDGTRASAAAVVPLLIDLVHPQSVIDIGCGTGLWLAAFRAHGVSDVMGVDGPWVDPGQREIPNELFRELDLTRPLRLERTFELALCLEVAEHLPPAAAEPLVEGLARLAPVVVFSAAIPHQGGDGHINERWPSFWIDLFARHGFEYRHELRRRVWTCETVEVWYRQNMLCFVAGDRPDVMPKLDAAQGPTAQGLVDVVHPDLLDRLARELERYRDYANRLEQRMQATVAELEEIRNSRSWRLIERLRPTLAAMKRILARVGLH